MVAQVCQEWFTRIRPLQVAVSAAAGCHDMVLYHGLARLNQLQLQIQALLSQLEHLHHRQHHHHHHHQKQQEQAETVRRDNVEHKGTPPDHPSKARPGQKQQQEQQEQQEQQQPQVHLRKPQLPQQSQPNIEEQQQQQQLLLGKMQQAFAASMEVLLLLVEAVVALEAPATAAGLYDWCCSNLSPVLQRLQQGVSHTAQSGAAVDATTESTAGSTVRRDGGGGALASSSGSSSSGRGSFEGQGSRAVAAKAQMGGGPEGREKMLPRADATGSSRADLAGLFGWWGGVTAHAAGSYESAAQLYYHYYTCYCSSSNAGGGQGSSVAVAAVQDPCWKQLAPMVGEVVLVQMAKCYAAVADWEGMRELGRELGKRPVVAATGTTEGSGATAVATAASTAGGAARSGGGAGAPQRGGTAGAAITSSSTGAAPGSNAVGAGAAPKLLQGALAPGVIGVGGYPGSDVGPAVQAWAQGWALAGAEGLKALQQWDAEHGDGSIKGAAINGAKGQGRRPQHAEGARDQGRGVIESLGHVEKLLLQMLAVQQQPQPLEGSTGGAELSEQPADGMFARGRSQFGRGGRGRGNRGGRDGGRPAAAAATGGGSSHLPDTSVLMEQARTLSVHMLTSLSSNRSAWMGLGGPVVQQLGLLQLLQHGLGHSAAEVQEGLLGKQSVGEQVNAWLQAWQGQVPGLQSPWVQGLSRVGGLASCLSPSLEQYVAMLQLVESRQVIRRDSPTVSGSSSSIRGRGRGGHSSVSGGRGVSVVAPAGAARGIAGAGGDLLLLGGLLAAYGSSCSRTFQRLLHKADMQAAQNDRPWLQVRTLAEQQGADNFLHAVAFAVEHQERLRRD